MIDIEVYSSALANCVNEDSCGFRHIAKDTIVVAVADGMGGLSCGDVASKLSVDVILDYCETHYNELCDETLLTSAMVQANKEIAAQSIHCHARMGASVAVAIITDTRCIFSWLGDVRIYHLRKNKIKQLTTDHVADGCDSTLLTRCINGRDFRFPIEVKSLEFKPEDTIQIATDGYYRHNTIAYEIAKPIKTFDDDATIINIRL
ncbi:MAG: protein phosphatase 2C domain-containing protein [Muribaculum sp.]|nr:protein phosphatase 2C domain-containing protein [Muribaculum sp.]